MPHTSDAPTNGDADSAADAMYRDVLDVFERERVHALLPLEERVLEGIGHGSRDYPAASVGNPEPS